MDCMLTAWGKSGGQESPSPTAVGEEAGGVGSAGGFDCFCASWRESRPAASCSLQPRGECSPQSKRLLRQALLITLHVAELPQEHDNDHAPQNL